MQRKKWGRTETGEGEEAELTASVKNIADGNMVTLQVFPEGSGPENGAAYGVFPLTVKNGSVSAKWKWESDRRELPPEEDPVFVFTAHCAWCQWKKSENRLKVKLVRPEITKAEWKDTEGKTVSKGLVGEPLKLVAETKDMEEGSGVTFTVYEEKSGKKVAETGATVKDGKAEAQWIYHYNGENLTEKPRYYYEVTGNRCRKAVSRAVEISAIIHCHVTDIFENPGRDIPYILITDSKKLQDGKADSDGTIKSKDIIPGDVYLLLSNGREHELKLLSGKFDNGKSIITVSDADLDNVKIKLSLNSENLIIINPDTAPASF